MSFKKARTCNISFKTWAMIMAIKNMILGFGIIVGGSVWFFSTNVTEQFKTSFSCGIAVGIINVIAGGILIVALVKGSENVVLLYLLLEFIILFILTIFTAMNNLDPEVSLAFLVVFFVCIYLWIGLYNVYEFYLELHSYNNESVRAGVEEILCNNTPNPLSSFPEKSSDTTTV